jgi:hypothetical protein
VPSAELSCCGLSVGIWVRGPEFESSAARTGRARDPKIVRSKKTAMSGASAALCLEAKLPVEVIAARFALILPIDIALLDCRSRCVAKADEVHVCCRCGAATASED